VQRASEHVQRPIKGRGQDLVVWYGILRFKEDFTTEMHPIPEGIGTGKENETVVIIALEDLHQDNGFLFRLPRGHDVCIDARASEIIPHTGGGLGIVMVLRI
jgi:hypothetical protein